jgi:hypothetical protein
VLTLERIPSTRVFQAGAGPGFLACLVAGNPPSDGPVTVRTLWEDALWLGWFVILASPPSNPEKFAQALESTPVLPAAAHTSFAWLQYIEATEEFQAVQLLLIEPGAAFPAAVADTPFAFRNFGFTIHGASPVLLSESGDRFTFAYPPLPNLPASVPGPQQLALAFDDAQRFCFQSEGLIGDFSDSFRTGWDVALRYYSGPGALQFWRYPVFANPAPGRQHLFRMNWDLFAPLDPARTFLEFTHNLYELTTTGGPTPVTTFESVDFDGTFPSTLRTLFGTEVGLRPVVTGPDALARLVFQSTPDASGQETRFSLAPSGDFELVLPSNAPDRLLCGLFGTEFLALESPAGTILRFHPNRPAFAPQFPILSEDGRANAAPLLDPRYKTSWVSIGSTPNAPEYYSQPPDAALFTGDETGEVLHLYDSRVASLALDQAFPMAGYGGLPPVVSPDDVASFEAQILAPARYGAITSQAVSVLTSGEDLEIPVTSTTPQGFLAKVQGLNWLEIVLARTLGLDGKVTQLTFSDSNGLPTALRQAFQSSELFLVISRNQNLGKFDNRIVIADWPFIINFPPESDEKFANVLIVKFGEGSVLERASDTASWTNAAAFNTNPRTTAAGIVAYFREAQAQAADTPALEPFVELMQNPNWDGVLALRVDIELKAFPADLKGLLGGMDLTRFYGHNLGLTLNFVERSEDKKDIEMPADSSLFALINYRDQYGTPAPAPEMPPLALINPTVGSAARAEIEVLPPALASSTTSDSETFDYRVITLLVEFRNSEVTNFESRIILTISRLFGETASLAASPNTVFRNSLVFDGRRQVIGGRASYSFRTSEEYRFLLTGTTMKYIQVRSAQFATLSQQPVPGQPATETIRSRFNLNGVLNFYKIPVFDPFSFGDESEITTLATAGLQFANLGIGMEFVLPPGQPLAFVLDPTTMSFDTALSQAREHSVFRKMPMTMSALLTGAADKSVKDLGYVPVRVTELSKLGAIGKDWFGLAFTLNLGTLGALASNAGFAATLLAAWSPGGDVNPVQLFLNLPGLGSGKKELSLQNILKLTIGGLSMAPLVNDSDETYAYVLRLRNIALSLLGQKLPTSGATDIALFSDFRDAGGGSSLSWYAAYYTEAPAPPSLGERG